MSPMVNHTAAMGKTNGKVLRRKPEVAGLSFRHRRLAPRWSSDFFELLTGMVCGLFAFKSDRFLNKSELLKPSSTREF